MIHEGQGSGRELNWALEHKKKTEFHEYIMYNVYGCIFYVTFLRHYCSFRPFSPKYLLESKDELGGEK